MWEVWTGIASCMAINQQVLGSYGSLQRILCTQLASGLRGFVKGFSREHNEAGAGEAANHPDAIIITQCYITMMMIIIARATS